MIDRKMTTEELPDWFVDLLILRATDGLDQDQQSQFDQFVQEHPNRELIERETEKFELTIAAVDLGFQQTSDVQTSMPEDLRQKVVAGAEKLFESRKQTQAAKVEMKDRNSTGGLTTREAVAWVAAAAAVILMFTGLNPFAPAIEKPIASNPEGQGTKQVQPVSLETQFGNFASAKAPDLVRVPWSAASDEAKASNASGEVVWRDSTQSGYMVFENLASNDPEESQYQLWIFDTVTDQKYPVDGGVFNVAAGEKTIVPIDARIPVAKAVMFAITKEVPGGVVVSDRKRLPLLALVE